MRAQRKFGRRPGMKAIELTVLVVACVLFGYAFEGFPITSAADVTSPDTIAAEPAQNDKDYSKFLHNNAYHSRLPCLLCHRRDDNSPRIGFPGRSGHLPCAGCHALQFSDNSSPICTICHTNAETGAMKRFPGLKSFTARFNHSRHARVSCSVCHKSSRGGVALSIPAGGTAHNTCFSCHTSRSSQNMSSCSVCHVPGRRNWTSESARAFRVNFSHSRHVSGARLSCSVCHTVKAGAARGRQVSAPAAAMHFPPARTMSCGGCHNSQRAFGTSDFSNCKRCHRDNTFKF